MKRHADKFYLKANQKVPKQNKLIQFKAYEPSPWISTVPPKYGRIKVTMIAEEIRSFTIGKSVSNYYNRSKSDKIIMVGAVDAAYEPINEVFDSRTYTTDWEKELPKFV